MTLHALMMSSHPPTVLIKSKTLEVIKLLKNLEKGKGSNLFYFRRRSKCSSSIS